MNVAPYPQTIPMDDFRSTDRESGSDNGWEPSLLEESSCSTTSFGRTN